ncbi:hypothetical protein SAMN04487911_14812 [Arenibacter nanhaiticus]|uniref:Uncharacterized protein n=1 Tax=Arenibacter nanhaiticus TaxID=558155 RepID=A0A1M6MVJ0_9FLAO|nr:hypothetical protein [Arenibacter nanhaiticus]SHJ87399.1 hypothetical protein SAMN04487911_14812 [Arenibacter nanhaiticus]
MIEQTNIQLFNALQKDIWSEFAQKWHEKWHEKKNESTFQNAVKNLYGFEKDYEWNILHNSFQVIDDSELAKLSFKHLERQKPSINLDFAERNLRLYGLLNAVSQQKLAIDNLLTIHKMANKTRLSKQLSQSKILAFSNKIVAHATSAKTEKVDFKHFFDVDEITMLKSDSRVFSLLRNQNELENLDFMKEIETFDKMVESNLSLIATKLIKKIYKNQGEFYKRLFVIELTRTCGMVEGDHLMGIKR